MKFGYARVSTMEQSLDLQLDALLKEGIPQKNIYTEKVSSNKEERKSLTKLLKYVRDGDTIIVWKPDRLARSMIHFTNLMAMLKQKGVRFRSITKPFIDTTEKFFHSEFIIMKRPKIPVMVVLIVIGWIFGFYLINKKVENALGLNDDFFISVAQTYYNDSFSGVSKKFNDWVNHGYKKIVLVNQSKTREVGLDYEWMGLFKFIEVGDSISKEKNNLDMRLRRKELDTIIRLNFIGIYNLRDTYKNYFNKD